MWFIFVPVSSCSSSVAIGWRFPDIGEEWTLTGLAGRSERPGIQDGEEILSFLGEYLTRDWYFRGYYDQIAMVWFWNKIFLRTQSRPGLLAREQLGYILGSFNVLIDRLAVRLGERRLFRLTALESDLPERSVARISPLETPKNWPHWPRPIRLLSPPEPVDQVMSPLPDGPPRRFRWRGRFYRVAAADDIRSNIHAGGKAEKVDIGATELAVAELIRPKLMADGMFLVGVDIVGDKILEVNVFSPGNLDSCSKLAGVDFSVTVLEAIERKVKIAADYDRAFDNRHMAIL